MDLFLILSTKKQKHYHLCHNWSRSFRLHFAYCKLSKVGRPKSKVSVKTCKSIHSALSLTVQATPPGFVCKLDAIILSLFIAHPLQVSLAKLLGVRPNQVTVSQVKLPERTQRVQQSSVIILSSSKVREGGGETGREGGREREREGGREGRKSGRKEWDEVREGMGNK